MMAPFAAATHDLIRILHRGRAMRDEKRWCGRASRHGKAGERIFSSGLRIDGGEGNRRGSGMRRISADDGAGNGGALLSGPPEKSHAGVRRPWFFVAGRPKAFDVCVQGWRFFRRLLGARFGSKSGAKPKAILPPTVFAEKIKCPAGRKPMLRRSVSRAAIRGWGRPSIRNFVCPVLPRDGAIIKAGPESFSRYP